MKKFTTAVLLTLGLGTALLFASPAGGKKRCGPDRNGMKQIVKQLDLSAEQKEQFKTLRESRKNVMKAKRKERKENRKAMRQKMRPDMSTFMTANSFDKEAFKQEMQKKHEARDAMRKRKKADMMEHRADHMEKMFNILTPEQRIKWIELFKKQKDQKQKNCESKNCKRYKQ